MVSHHEQQASEHGDEQQHRELWPAYSVNSAALQESTQRLFQQTQAIAQVCAFSSLFSDAKQDKRIITNRTKALPITSKFPYILRSRKTSTQMEYIFNHPWELGLLLLIALAFILDLGRRVA